jgi:predicted anti-sigma-YlaC factor YlaD
MTCKEIRELMPDMVLGGAPTSSEVREHLEACAGCAAKLEEIRKTMALLDEWQAPEPSPYFDTRLQARLREEAAKPASRGWLLWIRKPALGLVAAAVIAAGVMLISRNKTSDYAVNAPPGTAVGDLQQLDKNHDLYSETDFDLLDDLQVQETVNAN